MCTYALRANVLAPAQQSSFQYGSLRKVVEVIVVYFRKLSSAFVFHGKLFKER